MFVFLDIDGTLLNQRQAERRAAAGLVHAFGHHLPQPRTVDAVCQSWRALRDTHFPAYAAREITYQEYHRRRIRDLFLDGHQISDDQADGRYALFARLYRQAWRLYDDVCPGLQALSDYPLGVISNGNLRHQRAKLRRSGLLRHFSVVAISEELEVAKPHPEIFIKACRRAGIAPGRCVYVGDQLQVDVRPALAAGLQAVWLCREPSPPSAGVATIRSLRELSGWLAQTAANRPNSSQPAVA